MIMIFNRNQTLELEPEPENQSRFGETGQIKQRELVSLVLLSY